MRRSPSQTHLHLKKSFAYLICFLYTIAIVALLSPYMPLKGFELGSRTSAPGEFREIFSDTGIKVFQQDYPGQPSDFVTLVDLQAATIRNLTGAVNDEFIERRNPREFWRSAVDDNSRNLRARVVINGTFFGNGQSDTTNVAFGLKVRNRLISYGYGLNEYPGLNKTLAFHSFAGYARLENYDVQTFDSSIPDVIGALAAQADKSADRQLGRTFTGIIDRDQDSTPETVLFFSSTYSTQAHAANVLRSFGATATAMLDGGGSTSLIVNGIDRIKTDRTLPHAIAIYSGKPQDTIVSEAENDRCLNSAGFFGLFPTLSLANCNGSTGQRWSLIKGHLRASNNQCLEASLETSLEGSRGDASEGESGEGGRVQLRRCSQSSNQRWSYDNGALRTANNQCLDAGTLTVTADPEVLLRPCNRSLFQQWQRID
ncbi:ricin-type beta-trefoil lectin domain protein [Leptolyngbya ohadii]|uniref:ricin-type beta-trefoil lectin domain protein n=1 Tax=Leptolyngbya ohadii TaxID=1962290 RepID=UPI000B59DC4B|nr:ricin-type beta-trefoil lectin domain protein [Leptolyngbya ohadii]